MIMKEMNIHIFIAKVTIEMLKFTENRFSYNFQTQIAMKEDRTSIKLYNRCKYSWSY